MLMPGGWREANKDGGNPGGARSRNFVFFLHVW